VRIASMRARVFSWLALRVISPRISSSCS
jgi:hypothetical protein